tara:strand:- start:1290 stop:1598 length:309 start_codon:yes stop_codon:yes gene_type:complete
MKENPDEDHLPELSESERIHLEQMMVEKAFDNSYLVITKKATFEELLDRRDEFSHVGTKAVLIYDPSEGWGTDEVEDMIDYYEELEEYEKCAELKKILDVQL